MFTIDITITNPDGQQATVSGAFTFVPAPTIESVSPTAGPAAGGTPITIVGANFLPGAQVHFGGAAAADVTVSADGKTITAVTPPMV